MNFYFDRAQHSFNNQLLRTALCVCACMHVCVCFIPLCFVMKLWMHFLSILLGLNPLIYTISAVILLGTLAIVVIITCWIRARRSFHSSAARQSSTPHEYLDNVNDDEFTPLTSSEFVASLQERPPSYLESERMEHAVDSNERDNNFEDSTSIINTATLVLQLPRALNRVAEERIRFGQCRTSEDLERSDGTECTTGTSNIPQVWAKVCRIMQHQFFFMKWKNLKIWYDTTSLFFFIYI